MLASAVWFLSCVLVVNAFKFLQVLNYVKTSFNTISTRRQIWIYDSWILETAETLAHIWTPVTISEHTAIEYIIWYNWCLHQDQYYINFDAVIDIYISLLWALSNLSGSRVQNPSSVWKVMAFSADIMDHSLSCILRIHRFKGESFIIAINHSALLEMNRGHERLCRRGPYSDEWPSICFCLCVMHWHWLECKINCGSSTTIWSSTTIQESGLLCMLQIGQKACKELCTYSKVHLRGIQQGKWPEQV